MKNKKRIKSWLISFAIAFVCILAYSTLIFGVKNINVEGFVATIRVPGQYTEEAVVYYNYDFVEQSNDRSVITLIFQKEGYYLTEICNELYVFKVSDGIENDNYTIDLLSEERNEIATLQLLSILRTTAIYTGVLILIFILAFIISSIVLKYKNKTMSGFETEETEHEEPDIDISR